MGGDGTWDGTGVGSFGVEIHSGIPEQGQCELGIGHGPFTGRWRWRVAAEGVVVDGQLVDGSPNVVGEHHQLIVGIYGLECIHDCIALSYKLVVDIE